MFYNQVAPDATGAGAGVSVGMLQGGRIFIEDKSPMSESVEVSKLRISSFPNYKCCNVSKLQMSFHVF